MNEAVYLKVTKDESTELIMSVLSWLKPAALAVAVVAAGSLLVPAPVQAQEVTVLRGSLPQPLPPYSYLQNNSQDDQSANYSASGYDDPYSYYGDYGDGFPVGAGFGRFLHRGVHARGFTHGGFHGGLHASGFRGGGFRGGFHGGGLHGGGGHR
jgi:hypothetical protein